MSKTNNKVNKVSNFSGIIFLVAIIAITIFLAIFIFINVGKPVTIKDVTKMKHVTVENYKNYDTKHKEYYVYLYNTKSSKDAELKEVILEYANYARTHSDALPIYVMDYNDKQNEKITDSSNLNFSSDTAKERSIPTLIKISSGSKKDTKTTVSTIKTELFQAMGR